VKIEVELYGIARHRCGVGQVDVACGPGGTSFGAILAELADRFPGFAETCLRQARLADEFVANIDGQCFVADPKTPIAAGQTLLILSADAGG